MARKGFLFLFILILQISIASAQVSGYQKAFTIQQDLHDYNVRLLDGKWQSFDSALSQRIRLGYFREINNSWVFSTGLSNGFLLNQLEDSMLLRKSYAAGLDAGIQLRMNNGRLLKSDSRIGPYVLFAYQLDYIHNMRQYDMSPWQMSNSYGLGLNFRLGKKSVIQLQSSLDQQLGGDFDTHLKHRLGYVQKIGGKDEEEPSKPKKDKQPDMDKDGIADAEDKCPQLKGNSAFQGCPDEATLAAVTGGNQYGQLVSLDSVYYLLHQLDSQVKDIRLALNDLGNKTEIIVQQTKEISIIRADDKRNQTESKEGSKDQIQSEKNGADSESSTEVSQKENTSEKQTENQKAKENQTKQKEQESAKDNQGTTEEESEKTASDERTDENPAKTESSPANPFVDFEEGAEAWYVVALSSKNELFARNIAEKLSRDYPLVKLLPQENGYIRVGIYATRDRNEAEKVLRYAHEHGIPTGWLSFE